MLYYRQYGQSEFRILEMPIIGDTASVTISEDEVTPPFMEAYVLAQTSAGASETYPFENPQGTPTRIPVAMKSPKDQEILILSPDKSERLLPEDVYISISFVYAPNMVDRKRTKVFVDNIDLSSMAVSAGDLTIVSPDALPKNISSGHAHSAGRRVRYNGSPVPYDRTDVYRHHERAGGGGRTSAIFGKCSSRGAQ